MPFILFVFLSYIHDYFTGANPVKLKVVAVLKIK